MSTELSVETDYRNISRTHTTNPGARCSLYDPTVEYVRELSDSSETVQFRHSSVGIRQLAVGIEDSSGEHLPEKTKKRDGLVGSHRLKRRYTSANVIIAEWYNCL
jgi:hypothetical protein